MSVKLFKSDSSIAATPMARRIAVERGVDIASVRPGGKHGEVVAADVENAGDAMPVASHLAMRIAADKGIDLNTVKGSGFGGKIMAADLEGASAASLDAVVREIEGVIERHKMSAMRKAIAKRMFQSHDEIPNVTQNIKVDVTDLIAMRAQLNDGKEKADKVSMNDLIVKAIGMAIKEHERFRMTLDGEEFVLHDEVNVSVAVGMPDGLIVPVIRNVDKKNIFELSSEAKSIVKLAREGKLTQDDLVGGRITISNLGMYGTHSFTPIINQPEASIVGVCGVEDELALIDGQVAVRKKMMICVTYDHRILNGTEVSEFESYLKNLLENPIKLLV